MTGKRKKIKKKPIMVYVSLPILVLDRKKDSKTARRLFEKAGFIYHQTFSFCPSGLERPYVSYRGKFYSGLKAIVAWLKSAIE